MGFLSDLAGSFTGANERKAGKQAAKGQNEAGAMYGQLLPNATNRFQPFAQAGQNALTQYTGQVNGGAGEGFSFDPSNLESNPAYQFRLNQGLEGVNRAAGKSGNLNSGNRLLALNDYAQGAASQEYENEFGRQLQTHNTNYNETQNWMNRLQQLSAMGFDVNQLLTNVDMNATQGRANTKIGAANAMASGTLGASNALRGTLGTGLMLAGGAGYLGKGVQNMLGGATVAGGG